MKLTNEVVEQTVTLLTDHYSISTDLRDIIQKSK